MPLSRELTDTTMLQKNSNTYIPIRIELQNGSFIPKGIGKRSRYDNWTLISSSEHVRYKSKEYHVGDMVVVNVIDKRLGTRPELAVIAACRDTELQLVWVFETNNTNARKKLVGPDVALAYEVILSVYSDVAHVSALVGHVPPHERMRLCTDWILQLKPSKTTCITAPKDGCFMRRLIDRIKARGPDEAFAAPSATPDSTLPQLDMNAPSAPEWEEDGHQSTPLSTSIEQFTAERPTKRRKTDTLPSRSQVTSGLVRNRNGEWIVSEPRSTGFIPLAEPETPYAQLDSPHEPGPNHSRTVRTEHERSQRALEKGIEMAREAMRNENEKIKEGNKQIEEADQEREEAKKGREAAAQKENNADQKTKEAKDRIKNAEQMAMELNREIQTAEEALAALKKAVVDSA